MSWFEPASTVSHLEWASKVAGSQCHLNTFSMNALVEIRVENINILYNRGIQLQVHVSMQDVTQCHGGVCCTDLGCNVSFIVIH